MQTSNAITNVCNKYHLYWTMEITATNSKQSASDTVHWMPMADWHGGKKIYHSVVYKKNNNLKKLAFRWKAALIFDVKELIVSRPTHID